MRGIAIHLFLVWGSKWTCFCAGAKWTFLFVGRNDLVLMYGSKFTWSLCGDENDLFSMGID